MDALLIDKKQTCEDTFIYRVKPKEGEEFDFTAGQYVFITNPAYMKPGEAHPFSIASSSAEKNYLEFCIKVYGGWTRTLSKLEPGSELYISPPQGNFLWDETINRAVFLLGGIGIAPIMSMLRTIQAKGQTPELTILYGNRTPETIAYKDELEALQKTLSLKIVHIFSHVPEDHSWQGYRGFITEDIIRQEGDLSRNPAFFIIGPPVFIGKMLVALDILAIQKDRIKTENISPISPHST
jgi:ferredoxin-NADP reductase